MDVGCHKHKRGDISIDYSRDSNADIIADAHCLPFQGGVFDKVISVVVLEHSPNPLNFIKEQFRVLKEGGMIELTTDNAQYYRWSVLAFRGQQHASLEKDHCMIFYPKNVMRLMKLAGFKIICFKYIGNKKKIDLMIRPLVKLGLLRDACLYYRFHMRAQKGAVISKGPRHAIYEPN